MREAAVGLVEFLAEVLKAGATIRILLLLLLLLPPPLTPKLQIQPTQPPPRASDTCLASDGPNCHLVNRTVRVRIGRRK
jgi:hypothetical protein